MRRVKLEANVLIAQKQIRPHEAFNQYLAISAQSLISDERSSFSGQAHK